MMDQPQKPQTQPRPAPAPQRHIQRITVRFFLRHGAVVEWPVPHGEAFSFPALCQAIRSSGHFLSPEVYIPESEIACIGIDSGAGVKVQQPEHQTKQ